MAATAFSAAAPVAEKSAPNLVSLRTAADLAYCRRSAIRVSVHTTTTSYPALFRKAAAAI